LPVLPNPSSPRCDVVNSETTLNSTCATGKLLKFPSTRNGDLIVRAGQMRYWSLVGYEVPDGWEVLMTLLSSTRPIDIVTQMVMDEDIVLDRDRRYVIVLSRGAERPANSTAQNGVTRVDWEPSSEVLWTLRWLTVGLE
jgi:hypothetical protein